MFVAEGLALWRGPAYAEFAGSEFVAVEAARHEELRLVASETRFEIDLALGEDAALVPELEKAIGEQPTRERLWELLIRALYRAGRQSDALLAYVRARTVLADDLGVDPGAGLQAVHAAVLAQDPALDRPSSPAAPVRGVCCGSPPRAYTPLTGASETSSGDKGPGANRASVGPRASPTRGLDSPTRVPPTPSPTSSHRTPGSSTASSSRSTAVGPPSAPIPRQPRPDTGLQCALTTRSGRR